MSPPPQHAPASGGEPPSLDLGEVLIHGTYRHRFAVFGLLVVGTLGGLLYGSSLPPQFISSGKILVRFGAKEKQAPESPVPGTSSGGANAAGIEDEVQLLSNPALYHQVVLELGGERFIGTTTRDLAPLPGPLAVLEPIRGRLTSWASAKGPETFQQPEAALQQAVAAIAAGGSISNKARSKTIEVLFTADDPILARDVVDAYLRVFQKRHREVYTIAPQETFFTDQLHRALAEAERVRREHYEHIAECGHVDPTAQKARLLSDIQALESSMSQARTRLAAITSERAALQALLEAEPEQIETPVSAQVITNPVFTSLYTQESNLRGQLASLGTEFREGSPAYTARAAHLEAQIEAARLTLERTPTVLEISPARTQLAPNQRRATLTEQIQDLGREEQGLVGSQAHELWLLDEHERHMAQFIACEPRHLDLQDDLTRKESHVAELHAALDKAAIMGLIDRNEQMSNLVVIQKATMPVKPYGPSRSKYYLMGIVGSAALALGYLLLRHVTDWRVRYASHVAATAGHPLLGMIGEQPKWRRLGKQLRNQGRG
ncbi:MAG: hypothetical protein CMJ84_03090 [Planctomycetes bacterium]|nr:hypothetical protein [Planctomycetota bacterium]